jgi:multicomponent Na+:H+ antiporter subunit F
VIAVATVATALLGASAAMVVLRLVRGPSVLDRLVAMDMLLAVIAGGLGTYCAYTRDSTPMPVLVVVTLLGFVGSVTVTRFLAREKDAAGSEW